MPSVLHISYAEVTTLPYREVHVRGLPPTSPLRSIPRGNIHKLLRLSSFQSMERAVSTVPSGPT